MGRGKFYMKICGNSRAVSTWERGSSTGGGGGGGGGADNNWNSPILTMQSLQLDSVVILLFLFNISSISRIVFIVLTSKFVVEIQNLIYLSEYLYNLEPYGSNIAIYIIILYSNIGIFWPWLGQVLSCGYIAFYYLPIHVLFANHWLFWT
jgi:hypothetical protein